jgi:hypothetical protein
MLVNLTVTVQLVPGAMFCPVQVSGPARGPLVKRYVSMVPPVAATLVTATLDPPAAAVFVRLTVPVPAVQARIGVGEQLGKVIVSGFGVIDTVARAAKPVPVSVTGEPVTVAPV